MKRFIFCFSLWMATAVNLNAQTLLNGLMDEFRTKKLQDGTWTRYNLKLSDIQGTPFLDPEFMPGRIVASDGSIFTDIPLRYNGFSDDLEFQKGTDTYNIDPKTRIRRAEFGGKVFACLPFDDLGKPNNGFFEILTEGDNAILLIKYTVKFLEKEQVKAFADPKPARFEEIQKTYFISIDSGIAQQITTKKKLLEIFGPKKDEMETFISKNKLSIRGDDALTKIITHFNSL
jgi:hypothetical protein